MGDQYAARHNPFVYFHSIIDSADCAANVVDLDAAAAGSRERANDAEPLVHHADLCNDAHDEPCVDGRPGGLVSADAFAAASGCPQILASPAYQEDGLLIVTFDEAEATTASACCASRRPEHPMPAASRAAAAAGPARSLSPRSSSPAPVNDTPYNHYSLLRTVEDIFGLAHLGFAAQAGCARSGATCSAAAARVGRGRFPV